MDNYPTDSFLWLTAGGFDAASKPDDRGEKGPKAPETQLGDGDGEGASVECAEG